MKNLKIQKWFTFTEQELMESKKRSTAIIGAGPAGCMCAYFASQTNEVTLFDKSEPLKTLLYTGGGRCNLAYAEYNFKNLVKFYPRGEKFLYSIFSKFSTSDTIDFFDSIGVKTYVQDDLRIFPTSNSAKEVREKFLSHLKSCKFKKEEILEINKAKNGFSVKTNKDVYIFGNVVIATGGHSGFELCSKLGHSIIKPIPSLTGLVTRENFKKIQGVSLKNIAAQIFYQNKKFAQLKDGILFTHEGISGPLAYKISSICARLDYNKENPLVIKLDFIKADFDFQSMLNSNSKKDIKNLISEFIPKSLSEFILEKNQINPETKCSDINGKTRDLILKTLREFEIKVISPAKEGEIVTSGGVNLDEINPKTMESKLIKGLYFCGEVIDVDGFCGGFNLQNCWSTGYISGENI